MFALAGPLSAASVEVLSSPPRTSHDWLVPHLRRDWPHIFAGRRDWLVPHLRRDWPVPHLRRDWPHIFAGTGSSHICAGTGPTSAPGLAPPDIRLPEHCQTPMDGAATFPRIIRAERHGGACLPLQELRVEPAEAAEVAAKFSLCATKPPSHACNCGITPSAA